MEEKGEANCSLTCKSNERGVSQSIRISTVQPAEVCSGGQVAIGGVSTAVDFTRGSLGSNYLREESDNRTLAQATESLEL